MFLKFTYFMSLNQLVFPFQGPAASRTGIIQDGILTGQAGNCWEQGKYSVRTLYIQLYILMSVTKRTFITSSNIRMKVLKWV